MKIIINYKKPIFDDNSKITGFELFNRYIIVIKYNLNKKIFFLAVFLKFLILFLGIFKGNIMHFLRSLGNIAGVCKIIFNFK